MMKKTSLILLIVAAILLAACQQNTGSTPVPGQVEWKVPQPDSQTGVVVGRMVDLKGKIDLNGIPFLSKLVNYGATDVPPTVGFSVTYDPRGIVNEATGEFYCKDVIPGDNYVVVILSGLNELYIVREKDSENPLIVKVVAGQTLNLGDLVVETK